MDTIDTIDLRSLRLFEAVARHQSFSDAAREFAMPRAVVSKIIAQLEGAIGGKLFKRTTRKVGLTELGESLVAQSADTVAHLRKTLEHARSGQSNLAGVVRFSVSHAYGRRHILPLLVALRARHPEIRVEVVLSDAIDDLILKTLDFTIRLGPLPETSMIARRIGELDVALVGARALMTSRPPLKSIEDLTGLPMIAFRVPGSGTIVPWTFRKGRQQSTIDTKTAAVVTNSIEGVSDLVIAGVGIAPVPVFLIEDALKSGRLVRLLPDQRFSSIPVHICFADRAMMPKRVRLVIEVISAGVEGEVR